MPGPFVALVVTNPDAPKPPEGTVSEDRSNLGDLARVGKFHDFITQYGIDPTVAVFSRELPEGKDQPLGKLLHALDQAIAKNRNARLHAFATFLTLKLPFLQDVTEPVEINRIKAFAEQLQLKYVPLALDRIESERTKAYDLPAAPRRSCWYTSTKRSKLDMPSRPTNRSMTRQFRRFSAKSTR